MIFESLKEKCYFYREIADQKLIPNSYVIVMLDGRSFSSKIKNRFKKPFDDNFVNMMDETAKYLCQHLDGARFAFVQSDEISILMSDADLDTAFFKNRICKITSLAASMATGKFNQLMMGYRSLGNESGSLDYEEICNQPLYEFDCRAWNVPTPNDVYAWFLFRQIDCTRNSKQQTAQTWLSHKELMGKTAEEQIELLEDTKGIRWEDYPAGLRYGRKLAKIDEERENEHGKFMRKVWTITPAPDLFDEGNKQEFLDSLPVLA